MKEKLNEVIVSTIRTKLAPLVGALLCQLLLKKGIHFQPKQSYFDVITYGLTAVWYAMFRGIEVIHKNPKVQKVAGHFLMIPRVEVPKP